MPKSQPLVPLLAALTDLITWLKADKVSYAIIGGVAASFLGRPRVTRDIDVVVLVDKNDWMVSKILRIWRCFLDKISGVIHFH